MREGLSRWGLRAAALVVLAGCDDARPPKAARARPAEPEVRTGVRAGVPDLDVALSLGRLVLDEPFDVDRHGWTARPSSPRAEVFSQGALRVTFPVHGGETLPTPVRVGDFVAELGCEAPVFHTGCGLSLSLGGGEYRYVVTSSGGHVAWAGREGVADCDGARSGALRVWFLRRAGSLRVWAGGRECTPATIQVPRGEGEVGVRVERFPATFEQGRPSEVRLQQLRVWLLPTSGGPPPR